uniref:GRB10 interacting GYF protein 1a n=1 Tax=Oryzias sinensis TaxID=183150 RepID=A0A8C7XBP7_9TELE
MPAAVKLNASLKPLFALPLSKTQNGRCCCSIVSLCFFFFSGCLHSHYRGRWLHFGSCWPLTALCILGRPPASPNISLFFFFPHLQLLSCLCCHRASELTRCALDVLISSPRLRALSSGGSVTSPPPSPAMPKYKLAEYRYGREEMLALYVKDDKVPEDMQDKEFAAILQNDPMQPLALVPLTEEEQRNFSMSVNSVAVLRLMGKGVGGASPAGVARGRGAARGGRGRGRGEGGFYQRSIEETELGFSRGVREIHRSQSWDDRGNARFEKPLRREAGRPGFEEAGGPGAPGRKDYTRADSDNWRTLREEQEEEEGEPGTNWRHGVPRRDDGGPRSAGWRDHSGPGEGRRRKFDFDFRDSEGHVAGRRRAGSEGLEDDRDGLPEWCTEDAEEDGEMGTFDSSGAFMSIKVLTMRAPVKTKSSCVACVSDLAPIGISKPQLSPGSSSPSSSSSSSGLRPPAPSSSSAAALLPPSGGDAEDDDGMKHLQQEAEKMVASLQDTSLEEECFTQALQQQESRNTAAALPLSHEAAMKWFYKDPQGEIQGPFTTVEMCEWFQAGYFTMSLLVKRGCDEGFQPLGDVIKMWGRVPFAPGPSPPPLLGNLDQERLKKQQEIAAAAIYQQLQQQQQLFQCSEQGLMPSMNRSMSVPDTGSMWDMHTSASQPSGGEASLWDITMNSSTQGPTLEHLQKVLQERRDAELRAKREEEEQRKRREEKRRQQEEQKRREEEELFRLNENVFSVLVLVFSFLFVNYNNLDAHAPFCPQHSGLSMGSSSMGGQWADGVGMWGALESKSGTGGSSSSMGLWDEALKNQAGLRGNSNNLGLKNSRSSPSLNEQYMMRRKRTEEEEKLLKLLQGMKPQDGFTTWCEQMLHALNSSANNSSCSLDVATIVAYLKEVESPYAVLDFIRSYLGDTVEAKEFAKQFLERRAKQKANQQRQQQQQVGLSKDVGGLNMNFPLQSMFQANHMGKAGLYDNQGGKMKKKPPMMLHSDPSILGM